MKLLICGAAGQLGTELCRQLAAGGSVLGPLPGTLTGAQVIPVDLPDADLTDLNATEALIARHQPDVVLNCAAFTNVDAAESETDAAFAANALAPRNLAMACEDIGASLIQLSTDYVFSGEGEEPFNEADLPAPTSAYGRTKYLGEVYARQFCRRTFVVRTSWLYGRTGKNFVKTILRLAGEKEKINVVDDQHGNPTNAEDLAHHLLLLAPTRQYGIYHITGGGTCSWYQFAKEIVRLAGKAVKVRPCTSNEYKSPARRPANSALQHTMLRATVGDAMRPWQEALADYMQQSAT